MKISEFKKEMAKKRIDYSLLLNLGYDKKDSNVFYFTQVELSFCCLIVPKKGSPVLFVPELEYSMAKDFGRIKKVLKLKKKSRLSENLKDFFKGKKVKKLGVNKDFLSINDAKRIAKAKKGARLVDISKICMQLRQEKTEEEIRIMKKGCSISDKILEKAAKNFKFRTEAEMAAFLENETKKKGCGIAYEPIVASGKNSQYAHHKTDESRIKKGFLLIDFGIKYKGYCTDTSRTFYVGKPSKKEIGDYNKVLEAQEKAISSLRIGEKCSKIDYIARKSLGKGNKNFTHALGHGVGTFIHESPSFSEKSKGTIKKSMVFTIEPGIYRKKMYGIRIEDTVLMRERPEILTKIPKTLRRL